MIISLPQSREAYEWMRHLRSSLDGKSPSLRNSQLPVMILVFTEISIDALCAVKLLIAVLSADFIPFTIVPIRKSYDIFTEYNRYKSTLGQEKKFSILFINCGGCMDLMQVLHLDSEDVSQTRLFIMDTHRPIHLSNIYATSQIIVFDDGDLERVSQRYWPSFQALYILDDHIEGNEELDHTNTLLHIEKIRFYYEDIYQVQAVSSYIYAMMETLERTNLTALWICALGMQSRFGMEGIQNPNEVAENLKSLLFQDDEGYILEETEKLNLLERWENAVELLHRQVLRLNAITNSANNNSGDRNNEETDAASEIIKLEEEPSLLFLRFSCLYDALLFSPTVSRKLRLYASSYSSASNHANLQLSLPNGSLSHPILDTFLARIGIPLHETRQPYLYMERALKRRFSKQYKKWMVEANDEEAIVELGLDALFGSHTRLVFTKKLLNKTTISSMETVYCLDSLLASQGFLKALESFPLNSNIIGRNDSDRIFMSSILRGCINQQRQELSFILNLVRQKSVKFLKQSALKCLVLNDKLLRDPTMLHRLQMRPSYRRHIANGLQEIMSFQLSTSAKKDWLPAALMLAVPAPNDALNTTSVDNISSQSNFNRNSTGNYSSDGTSRYLCNIIVHPRTDFSPTPSEGTEGNYPGPAFYLQAIIKGLAHIRGRQSTDPESVPPDMEWLLSDPSHPRSLSYLMPDDTLFLDGTFTLMVSELSDFCQILQLHSRVFDKQILDRKISIQSIFGRQNRWQDINLEKNLLSKTSSNLMATISDQNDSEENESEINEDSQEIFSMKKKYLKNRQKSSSESIESEAEASVQHSTFSSTIKSLPQNGSGIANETSSNQSNENNPNLANYVPSSQADIGKDPFTATSKASLLDSPLHRQKPPAAIGTKQKRTFIISDDEQDEA